MDQLIQYDQELFIFLNTLGNTTWDQFWLIVTHKLSAIPLYAILLFLIYREFGLKGMFITILVVAALITCADQLANAFKHGIQRPRPCRAEGVQDLIRFVAPRCGRYGFFSGHATNSMALAVFIGLVFRTRFPFLIFGMLFWAAMTAYSRIYVGVHYPLDILCGMIAGALLGWGAYLIHTKLKPKF